jgi:sugar/nucleoside kinase (ribokinase family)
MTHYDILGIGNAIVDVIAPAEPVFLDKQDMRPGSMTLIDADRAQALTALMPQGRQSSGGSVANSCAVAACLGARVGFLGKVADDALGEAFAREIASAGVRYTTAPLIGGAPTARCLILVTPDGQRTMNTYLGACVSFGPGDLDLAMIAGSAITYLEGYLFDPPEAQAAFVAAAAAARAAGRRVALSLSDPFCVDRHRAAFRALLPQIDIVVANEMEITSLYESNSFEDAAGQARRDVGLAALTRGADGSLILCGEETVVVQAAPTTVVDTTGAGDCYAAGFLTSLARGAGLAACGALGSEAAAACIAGYGARPEAEKLHELGRAARVAAAVDAKV